MASTLECRVSPSRDGRAFVAVWPDYFAKNCGLNMRVSRAELEQWRRQIDTALKGEKHVDGE